MRLRYTPNRVATRATFHRRGESREQRQEHIHVLVRRTFELRHAKGKAEEYLFTIFVESAARLQGRPYLLVRSVDLTSWNSFFDLFDLHSNPLGGGAFLARGPPRAPPPPLFSRPARKGTKTEGVPMANLAS